MLSVLQNAPPQPSLILVFPKTIFFICMHFPSTRHITIISATGERRLSVSFCDKLAFVLPVLMVIIALAISQEIQEKCMNQHANYTGCTVQANIFYEKIKWTKECSMDKRLNTTFCWAMRNKTSSKVPSFACILVFRWKSRFRDGIINYIFMYIILIRQSCSL